MSRFGAEKFLGRKAGKRARRYLSWLVEKNEPYAVHWRMATHGEVTRNLCHPFRTQTGALVMHNGVITETARYSSKEDSDTSLFVRDYLFDAPHPAADGALAYYRLIGTLIGRSNKLLVLHDETFHIVNEDSGVWSAEGIWYSNTYSLPYGHTWKLEEDDDEDFPSLAYSKPMVNRWHKDAQGDWVCLGEKESAEVEDAKMDLVVYTGDEERRKVKFDGYEATSTGWRLTYPPKGVKELG
jgi:hypothetical protein